jgi:exodeoxyribonuclease VII large subunit
MSKDQLGWDQILNGDEAPAEKSEPLPLADNVTSQAAKVASDDLPKDLPKDTPNDSLKDKQESPPEILFEELSEKIKKPRKKASAKAKQASTETPAEPTQYSKKNWGKLEFNIPARQDAGQAARQDASPARTSISTLTGAVAKKVTIEKAETVTIKTSPIVSENVLDGDSSLEAPEDAGVDAQPEVLSVSELNRYIREILEGRFPLLWLKGEISNFKAHTSGHFYFSLKDAKAQISAVMFRGFNSQLRFRPEDGMEVLIRGKVTVYEPRGNYQIFCEVMEPVGAGALQKAFEQLKAKLQKEGLFDEARKRSIPSLPRHIAIVTSPTGAAIRDMLNVLGRRFKGVRITLVPCKVQGDAAPREICEAITLANRLTDVDVMIVGRGGGSIEDLWAFNEERVARAIATSRVPVISAVGHEVDFTIADFVADLRAPTPSAAAELVVKNAADLIERLAAIKRGLRYAVLRKLNMSAQLALGLTKRLVDPQRSIQDASLRCDELLQRLHNGVERYIDDRRLRIELLREKLGTPLARMAKNRETVIGLGARLRAGVRNTMTRKRERLELNMAVLDSLSPLKVLDRGFSMVLVGGKILTHASEVKVGDSVQIRMCKGSVEAQVTSVEPEKR